MVNSEFADGTKFYSYKKYIKGVEETMTETFRLWPKPYPSISKMVQAGLYYTGADDMVSCIHCGISLDTWTPEDSPLAEHKRANPMCNLVNIVDDVEE